VTLAADPFSDFDRLVAQAVVKDLRAGEAKAEVRRYLYDPVGWARDCIDWRAGGCLTAYQQDVLAALPVRRRVAVRGPHGLGKAQPHRLVIDTPDGERKFGDLRVGDTVFGSNGRPVRVAGIAERGEMDVYRVTFDDGSSTLCSADHLWTVKRFTWSRNAPTEWVTMPLSQIAAEGVDRSNGAGRARKWALPTVAPLEYPYRWVPVDPYTLGAWLGDGSVGKPAISGKDKEVAARIRAAGYEITETEVRTCFSWYVRGLGPGLRALGVLSRGARDKAVPAAYRHNLAAVRRELLRGLLDTDGTVTREGNISFCSTSPRLAEDVAWLARSLGGMARVHPRTNKNGPFWIVNLTLPDERWFYIERKQERVRPVSQKRYLWRWIAGIEHVGREPVRCIEVSAPDGLYVANDAILTHNSGLAAITVLWFSTTRDAAGYDWKVLTTASAWRHLAVYLWPEIHKWARLIKWDTLGRPAFSDRAELIALNLKLQFGAASAVASNRAELLEGAHADSLLYLIDEAKIVPNATWDAIEGAFSGGRTEGLPEAFALAVSTPGPPAGRFYEIHKRARGLEDWWTRHVTLEEAIAAGRISRQWAEQRKRQWGADSALYANRVLGEFHASDEDSVIPLAWVEAAVERWHAWDDAGRPPVPGRRVLSVDVARSGGDATVFARRSGVCVEDLEEHHKEDTMKTTARVQGALADGMTSIVDSIGVGGGVVDRLRELKVPVIAYTGSAKTDARDRTREFGFTNCLTGDAQAEPVGDLLRIYRSRHEGPLFKVKTARGDEFTATPNHQILTPRGWVAVQFLRAGDELCDAGRRNASVIAAETRPEVDDMPPTLGEVYRAADRLFGAERMLGGTVNFHGDVPVGDVDVVTLDRQLLMSHPSCGQFAEDAALIRTLVGQRPLARHRAPVEALCVLGRNPRVATSFPDHGMSRCSGRTLLDRQPVNGKVVRLSDVPLTHAVVAQDVADEVLAYPICLTQGFDGLTRQIPSRHLRAVDPCGAPSPGYIRLRPKRNAMLQQDSAYNVLVNSQIHTQTMHRLASSVARHDGLLINCRTNGETEGLRASSWLDAMLTQDFVDGVPVSSEQLAQRLQRGAGNVPLDQIVSVELTTDASHGPHFVYTLETTTGSYRTQNTAHRNCRSAAYWRVRELLDPAFGAELMLPPNELLLSDLTTPTWTVVTGVPPKIQVEKKEDVVARLGRSPDYGDAVVMGFWADRHGEGSAVGAAPLASANLLPWGR
jgi:intein/homing endonuclease